jgi:alpha-1,2-mannosyltransferase
LDQQLPDFFDAFRNPPFFALVFVPLSLLPLVPSFGAWSLVSIGCLAAALWLMLDLVPGLKLRWRGLCVLVLAFPPVYFGLIDGQNATLSLLLYVLIYRGMLFGQQARTGFWAGLGLFKPQLFFVFPILFLATKRWRALAAYCVTAIGLAIISVALVGLDGLRQWLWVLAEFEGGNAEKNAWRMHSLRTFFDLLLPGHWMIAVGLTALVSIVLLVALVATWRSTDGRSNVLPVRWAFTAIVAVLLDPHLVDYDLTVLVLAGVLTCAALTPLRLWAVLLYPLLLVRAQVPVGAGVLSLTALLLLGIAFVLWLRVPHGLDRSNTPTRLPSTKGIAAA